MKFYHILLLLPIFSLGCRQEMLPVEGAEELLGDWELIEVLYDPGNGSGVFTPVDSDARISFFADGSFVSNHDLCTLSTIGDENQKGVFSPMDMTLTPEGCNFGQRDLSYQVGGDTLVLSFPCIEPCLQKYLRTD